eukprot:m.361947 g.361947  ORF g.361947 m.361947 type:complete len:1891 (+) comp20020_c0_seq1:168-5840(+)
MRSMAMSSGAQQLLCFFTIAACCGHALGVYSEIFLCGFRPKQSCQFDGDSRCQFFKLDFCTQFSSNAFEEFGLTEIYARIQEQDGLFSFRVFKNPDCTGDPFGFKVELTNVDLEECKPLNLPFVGNQADFMFLEACEICSKDSSLLSTAAPDMREDLPPEVFVINEPRLYGFPLQADPLGTDSPCLRFGYDQYSAEGDRSVDYIDPHEVPLIWSAKEEEALIPHAETLFGDGTAVYSRIWCIARTQPISYPQRFIVEQAGFLSKILTSEVLSPGAYKYRTRGATLSAMSPLQPHANRPVIVEAISYHVGDSGAQNLSAVQTLRPIQVRLITEPDTLAPWDMTFGIGYTTHPLDGLHTASQKVELLFHNVPRTQKLAYLYFQNGAAGSTDAVGDVEVSIELKTEGFSKQIKRTQSLAAPFVVLNVGTLLFQLPQEPAVLDLVTLTLSLASTSAVTLPALSNMVRPGAAPALVLVSEGLAIPFSQVWLCSSATASQCAQGVGLVCMPIMTGTCTVIESRFGFGFGGRTFVSTEWAANYQLNTVFSTNPSCTTPFYDVSAPTDECVDGPTTGSLVVLRSCDSAVHKCIDPWAHDSGSFYVVEPASFVTTSRSLGISLLSSGVPVWQPRGLETVGMQVPLQNGLEYDWYARVTCTLASSSVSFQLTFMTDTSTGAKTTISLNCTAPTWIKITSFTYTVTVAESTFGNSPAVVYMTAAPPSQILAVAFAPSSQMLTPAHLPGAQQSFDAVSVAPPVTDCALITHGPTCLRAACNWNDASATCHSEPSQACHATAVRQCSSDCQLTYTTLSTSSPQACVPFSVLTLGMCRTVYISLSGGMIMSHSSNSLHSLPSGLNVTVAAFRPAEPRALGSKQAFVSLFKVTWYTVGQPEVFLWALMHADPTPHELNSLTALATSPSILALTTSFPQSDIAAWTIRDRGIQTLQVRCVPSPQIAAVTTSSITVVSINSVVDNIVVLNSVGDPVNIIARDGPTLTVGSLESASNYTLRLMSSQSTVLYTLKAATRQPLAQPQIQTVSAVSPTDVVVEWQYQEQEDTLARTLFSSSSSDNTFLMSLYAQQGDAVFFVVTANAKEWVLPLSAARRTASMALNSSTPCIGTPFELRVSPELNHFQATLRGLSPNTEYSVKVRVQEPGVSSTKAPSSQTMLVTTHGTVPEQNVTVSTSVFITQASLSWTAVPLSNGHVTYDVELFIVSSNGFFSPVQRVQTRDTTAVFEFLEPQSYYTVNITAMSSKVSCGSAHPSRCSPEASTSMYRFVGQADFETPAAIGSTGYRINNVEVTSEKVVLTTIPSNLTSITVMHWKLMDSNNRTLSKHKMQPITLSDDGGKFSLGETILFDAFSVYAFSISTTGEVFVPPITKRMVPRVPVAPTRPVPVRIESTAVELSVAIADPVNGYPTYYHLWVFGMEDTVGSKVSIPYHMLGAEGTLRISAVEANTLRFYTVSMSTSAGEGAQSKQLAMRTNAPISAESVGYTSTASLATSVVLGLVTGIAIVFVWHKFVRSKQQVVVSSALLDKMDVVWSERYADIEPGLCQGDLEEFEPAITRLTVQKELSSGSFGRVQLAYMTDGSSRSKVTEVHCLDESVDDWCRASVLVEACVMHQASHPNLQTCIGIMTSDAPIRVVSEHPDLGTLQVYLQNCQQELFGQQPLLYTTQLLFSLQIAGALQYLHSVGVSHRSVRSASVLVCTEAQVKLGHPGRLTFNSGAMVSQRFEEDVVRWMPPEAFDASELQLACDVWSFGVLVWEILTHGKTPFGEIPSSDVQRSIQQGAMLDIPVDAAPEIGDLMKDCWRSPSATRPTMAEVEALLLEMNNTASKSGRKLKTASSASAPASADETAPVNPYSTGLGKKSSKKSDGAGAAKSSRAEELNRMFNLGK